MLEDFKNNFYEELPDFKEYQIYVATSGGIDSVALCHLLHQCGIYFKILHCNFKLRGEDSDLDEKFVSLLANKLDKEFYSISFNTIDKSKKSKTNIQLTARNLRYTWFNQITSSDKNPVVLTAHHLDDNIETFLLNISRGTSVKGAGGIPKFRDIYYRPLLKFSKSKIIKFIALNDIEYRTDSSNQELKYKRNTIRHKIIPELEKITPSIKENIQTFMNDILLMNDDLENESDQFKSLYFKESEGIISVTKKLLLQLSDIKLQYLFKSFGITRAKIQEFRNFLDSSNGAIRKIENFEFLINRDKLLMRNLENKVTLKPIQVYDLPFNFKVGNSKYQLSRAKKGNVNFNSNNVYCDFSIVQFPLTIRSYNNGEKFISFGSKQSKLISDILINQKLSLFEKEEVFIIEDSKRQSLFLDVITSNHNFKVTKLSTEVLILSKFIET
ncbi:MAG: tRNA lysidine(34) synthetase TilS [Crocinitomicaceae bacterium]